MSATDGDGMTVLVVAVVAATVCAFVGWWLAARRADAMQTGTAAPVTSRYVGMGLVLVALTSAVGIVAASVIGVFFLWVVLNRLLGAGEHAPFSTYPMFAEPRERSWALRYELPEGSLLNLVMLGIQPPTARKRFSSEFLLALEETNDRTVARRRAAETIAEWVQARRPTSGPLATEPIAIVLIEYEFDGRTIATRRSVLTVVASP